MRVAALLAVLPVSLLAVAQDPHAGHGQPSQTTPAPNPPDPHASHQKPPDKNDPHAGHVMPTGEGDIAEGTAAGLPVGDSLPPAVIRDNAADATYGTASMARARDVLSDEHGGALVSKLMSNILELTMTSGEEGYRWDVEGWYGGDLHRFVFKTEGEGPGGEVDSAEMQALYSRAVGRYTDLQAGVRYDFQPNGLAYAAVGIETLLPYWFDVEGALFLSEQGDVFARLEGSYDLRFTQRLILQPRLEVTLSAQDVPESDMGSGFSSAEVGLRLRYDIRREFAPYLGVNFERSLSRTADLVRASGGEVSETTVVVGVRGWF
jgi:copper resistance protein B